MPQCNERLSELAVSIYCTWCLFHVATQDKICACVQSKSYQVNPAVPTVEVNLLVYIIRCCTKNEAIRWPVERFVYKMLGITFTTEKQAFIMEHYFRMESYKKSDRTVSKQVFGCFWA